MGKVKSKPAKSKSTPASKRGIYRTKAKINIHPKVDSKGNARRKGF
jgi:hypothetical protein